jgi:hypothetical protein
MGAYTLVTLQAASIQSLEQRLTHWLMLMGTMGSVSAGSGPREIQTYLRKSGNALLLLIEKSGSKHNLRWLDFAGGFSSGFQACPGTLFDVINRNGGKVLEVVDYGVPPQAWQNAR